MTSDPTPKVPPTDPDEELSLEVLDEVAGGVQQVTVNITFN